MFRGVAVGLSGRWGDRPENLILLLVSSDLVPFILLKINFVLAQTHPKIIFEPLLLMRLCPPSDRHWPDILRSGSQERPVLDFRPRQILDMC